MDEELTSLLLLLLFQTNAEQQTKIQDLQEKLSKVDWTSQRLTRASQRRSADFADQHDFLVIGSETVLAR